MHPKNKGDNNSGSTYERRGRVFDGVVLFKNLVPSIQACSRVSAMNSLSQPSSQSRREHSLRSTLILRFIIRYVQGESRCSSEKSDYLFRILPTFYIWTLERKKKNTFPLLSGSTVRNTINIENIGKIRMDLTLENL